MSDLTTVSFENDWTTSRIGAPQLGEDGFFKFKEGENRIRIAGKYATFKTHYEKAQDGKFKRVTCLGDDCPICKAGNKPRTQYQCKVIDKSNWDKNSGYSGNIEVKIATIPFSVMQDIVACIKDPDYGNPLQYDFKINKQGKGLSTTYSTRPDPNKEPLTTEEKEAIKKCPNIQDIAKFHTLEEIKNMKLVILDGEANPQTQEENTTNNTEVVQDSSWDDFD